MRHRHTPNLSINIVAPIAHMSANCPENTVPDSNSSGDINAGVPVGVKVEGFKGKGQNKGQNKGYYYYY